MKQSIRIPDVEHHNRLLLAHLKRPPVPTAFRRVWPAARRFGSPTPWLQSVLPTLPRLPGAAGGFFRYRADIVYGLRRLRSSLRHFAYCGRHLADLGGQRYQSRPQSRQDLSRRMNGRHSQPHFGCSFFPLPLPPVRPLAECRRSAQRSLGG